MLNILLPKIAIGITGALLVGGLLYTINDYLNLKSAYKVSQKTIEVLEHKRQVTDNAMVIVEKKQNANFSRSNKALIEMEQKGYITTDDGNNPKWLRSSTENDN